MVMLCDKISKADLPDFLTVCGTEWIAEEKLDGDRMRMIVREGKVQLLNRRLKDVTEKFPELNDINVTNVITDGEMCVIDENGVSQFNTGIAFRTHCKSTTKIESAAKKYPITYVIFDILEIDGKDLREVAWIERRKILDSLEFNHPNVIVNPYSEDIQGLWKQVTDKGGEGIILKKVNAPYSENRRSSVWKKVKDIKEVDLTFINYTQNPAGIRIETEDGIACQVSGFRAPPVKAELDSKGKATVTINHLGWTGKAYRQPTFKKLVEV